MVIKSGKQMKYYLLCLSVFLLLLLMGCSTKYPYDYGTASRWVSESPKFVLEYWETPYGPYRFGSQEYLEINEERYPVFVGYQSNLFDVYPADSYSHNSDDLLFRGTWKICGNKLIVTIDEDNLFEGIYEKIYFTYEELEPETKG